MVQQRRQWVGVRTETITLPLPPREQRRIVGQLFHRTPCRAQGTFSIIIINAYRAASNADVFKRDRLQVQNYFT